MNKLRITTFIGEESDDHLGDLEKIANKHESDLIITPQEYFGGLYKNKKPYHTEAELLPLLENMSIEHNVAIITGVVERENEHLYQRLWFIDQTLQGKVTKFATTTYEMDWYGLSPETNMANRFKTFKLKGINVAGFFCWEVFSDILFCGLGMLEPDLVASCIKFGIAAYPNLDKDKSIKKIERCDGDIWLNRLKHISEFETKCPIACSTNSWGQTAKTMPLHGIIYPYEKMEAEPYTEPGQVNTREMDFDKVRGYRENKYSYLDRVGKFPSYDLMPYTMMFKIHRIEQRMMGKTKDDLNFDVFKKARFENKRRTKW